MTSLLSIVASANKMYDVNLKLNLQNYWEFVMFGVLIINHLQTGIDLTLTLRYYHTRRFRRVGLLSRWSTSQRYLLQLFGMIVRIKLKLKCDINALNENKRKNKFSVSNTATIQLRIRARLLSTISKMFLWNFVLFLKWPSSFIYFSTLLLKQ